MTFRNNFVHENLGDGIWYDFNNTGALIEGNRVEDNGRTGISFEVSNGATIRNNTLRRNAADAVLISVSQNAQIYNNSLEANFGGIQYFLNCASLLEEGQDLTNNAAYDNTIVVGTQSYTYANGFSSTSSCTSAQLAPYLNGSKNLTFSRNTYSVPSRPSARYFIWGGSKYWNEWQALGHDLDGSRFSIKKSTNLSLALHNGGANGSRGVAPYLNGSKNLTFSSNTYRVPLAKSTRPEVGNR